MSVSYTHLDLSSNEVLSHLELNEKTSISAILIQGCAFQSITDILKCCSSLRDVYKRQLQHRLILTAEAEMEGYSPVKVSQNHVPAKEHTLSTIAA